MKNQDPSGTESDAKTVDADLDPFDFDPEPYRPEPHRDVNSDLIDDFSAGESEPAATYGGDDAGVTKSIAGRIDMQKAFPAGGSGPNVKMEGAAVQITGSKKPMPGERLEGGAGLQDTQTGRISTDDNDDSDDSDSGDESGGDQTSESLTVIDTPDLEPIIGTDSEFGSHREAGINDSDLLDDAGPDLIDIDFE